MAKNILPSDAAVLYLRMSSTKQDKSIPAQRDELLKLAKRKGYTIVREYLDEAISGDSTEKRSGFLRLRADCEAGPDFSIILVWNEDRFSRNDPLELGWWIKPIRDSGVIIETPTGKVDWESLGGRLIYLIGQEMRHDFLRTLSKNVSRGLLSAANAGRSGTGGAAPQGLRDDPDRAEIVQRIFADYLKSQASLRSVAEGLNRDGIRSPRGKGWSVTTIRFVLCNQKYTGDYIRFKYRAGKYNAIRDGEIVSRGKTDRFEQVEPMVVEDHHKGIIDRQTFGAAQRKLQRQRGATAKRTGRQYVFSGLLRCGDCGLAMCGVPYERGEPGAKAYRCHTYQDGGRSACHRNQIKEDILLDGIVRLVEREYLSDKAIDRLREKIQHLLAARRRPAPVNADRLRKQITDLDRQLDQGADRVLSAPENLVGTIYAKLDQLKAERDQLQAQLQAAGSHRIDTGGDDEGKIEEALDALRILRKAFTEAEPADVRELLSTVVSKVELRFAHREKGGREVNELQGGTILVRPTAATSKLLSSLGF